MFVQVIQGSVTDLAEVHAALDRWAEQLSPDAVGWLGTTAGVSADHRFIAVVRFDSEDAARRNSDRSEQDEWWARTSKLFSDEPVFSESTEIDVDLQGDPDQAGFVQVISGRSSDPARARELMGQDSDTWAAFQESGNVWNPEIANRFKTMILKTGNETDRTEAYGAFRGRDPDPSALMRRRGFPVQ